MIPTSEIEFADLATLARSATASQIARAEDAASAAMRPLSDPYPGARENMIASELRKELLAERAALRKVWAGLGADAREF